MPAKKKEKIKHLGRGLQSLLGPITTDSVANNPIVLSEPVEQVEVAVSNVKYFPDKALSIGLRELPVNSITANPYQPRTTWNEDELAELSKSILANGVIQPILVRSIDGQFQLIAGERRLRASRLAGLEKIPALIRQATDEEMLELALVENIHRTNLNPIERAKAYRNYIKAFSLTQQEAAEKLGEGRSVIANYLRLLDLPLEIKDLLVDGQLSMGHARAILALPTDDLRRKLANRTLAGRLSVREVERLVKRHLAGGSVEKAEKPAKAPHIVDMEGKLTSAVGTRVYIEPRKNPQRGRIVIEFYSLDDFDRITDSLGLSQAERA